jgi:hypothetical protein
MSDYLPDQPPSRHFVPGVKPLENRVLLSSASSPFVHLFPFLPRTGGVSVQRGTLLGIGVGQPTSNTAQVTDDGKGDIQADWNRGPVKSFTGVTTTIVQAERAKTDEITFSLTNGRTGPTAVLVGSVVPIEAATPGRSGHASDIVRVHRTSGLAVESGSLLTVTVDRPKTNLVQITNESAGNVQVEWNGGPAHSFSGVETVVVDTTKAGKDQVTLND